MNCGHKETLLLLRPYQGPRRMETATMTFTEGLQPHSMQCLAATADFFVVG